jgi:predicted RNA binding protein with dsRBD fold (UPF0201 family)
VGTIIVTIEAEINPTESEEKVKKAVWNMFGDIHTQTIPIHKGNFLIANVKGLETLATLRNVLRRDRIRDASRKPLFQGLNADVITFYLNKQVAFAGHVSFSEANSESPLGPIKVIVESENPRELIDWLAPRTNKN